MSTPDTGGPAFPSIAEYIPNLGFRALDGMTLRDYFAAKAMASFVRNYQNTPVDANDLNKAIARWSYNIADAMLEARK